MDKNVLLKIKGLQFEFDNNEPIEVIIRGKYYNRNGKHFILYDEVDENGECTKNSIKVSKEDVELIKKGTSNTHMLFQKGRKNLTCYTTPYGSMMIGINATKLNIDEQENKLEVDIDYILDVNYNYISDCRIKIEAVSS